MNQPQIAALDENMRIRLERIGCLYIDSCDVRTGQDGGNVHVAMWGAASAVLIRAEQGQQASETGDITDDFVQV